MFWLQAAVSFLIWLGYGVLQSRRSQAIRTRMLQLSRTTRGAGGIALLVLSLAFLFVAMAVVIRFKGFGQNGMEWWAWTMITVLGLGFVHAQTMATAMLVTLAQESVTRTPSETSTVKKQQQPGTHEKPPV